MKAARAQLADVRYRGRFQVRGRRGLNRMRFTGRLRGRPLASGAYMLEAVATDRAGPDVRSPPAVALQDRVAPAP